MLIGDTYEFAIEYSFAPDYSKEMGFGRIWVKGDFIGTYLDLIYLGSYPFYILDCVNDPEELQEDLKQLSKEELFNLFESNELEDLDKYRVTSTTFIDDFSIWCYKINNMTYILWKIINRDFFEDLKDYTNEVILKSVSPDIVKEVIDKYKKELIDLEIIK